MPPSSLFSSETDMVLSRGRGTGGGSGGRGKALDALKLASAPMVSSRTRKRNSLRRPARVGARPPLPARTMHRTMHRLPPPPPLSY